MVTVGKGVVMKFLLQEWVRPGTTLHRSINAWRRLLFDWDFKQKNDDNVAFTQIVNE